jgi:hypothetical protein
VTELDPHLLDLIRTATKAAVDEALARSLPTVTPGTVENFDPAEGICSVVIDGDSAPTPGIANLSGDWPSRGSRVMVTFIPPHGAFVTAVHKSQGSPGIEVQGRALAEPLAAAVAEYLPWDTVEGGFDPDVFEVTTGPTSGIAAIRVLIRARFRAHATISHTSAAAGRRFIGFAINEVPGTPGGVLDLQTGATGVFVGSASRPLFLEAGDLVQVRSLSSVALNATVESFSLQWIGPFAT